MVNNAAGADLRATKMLIDMMKDIEKKAGIAPPETPTATPADEEVMASFVARLRASWEQEIRDKDAGNAHRRGSASPPTRASRGSKIGSGRARRQASPEAPGNFV